MKKKPITPQAKPCSNRTQAADQLGWDDDMRRSIQETHTGIVPVGI
jgi:hypothetical protein